MAEQKQPKKSESTKGGKRPSVEQMIRDAVLAGIAAGRSDAPDTAAKAFHYAEDRISNYHTLLRKIERDKIFVEQVQIIGTPERSKSILRYSKSGVRLTPEEQLQAVITSTQADIARNEAEAEAIRDALKEISTDEYYFTVEQRYFHNKTDDEIAEASKRGRATIWRNRTRLVRKIAVHFYGSAALV